VFTGARLRYSSTPVTEPSDTLQQPAEARGDEAADPQVGPSEHDLRTVAALIAGDERAFGALVDAHGPQMLRLAMVHTPSRAVAEDVVQEAWIGVLEGLGRFEGRSSLKTWILRILVNRAITRGRRERRSAPFSSVWDANGPGEPAVDPTRFLDQTATWPGHWSAPPTPWDEVPEDRLLSGETLAFVRAAMAALPPAQREVITLRDVEGWTSKEVCNALEVTETNQRVLLHRARSSVRRALEGYLAPEG
jgi:RNA polymerase sigma-70 factor (ECF subfamily)